MSAKQMSQRRDKAKIFKVAVGQQQEPAPFTDSKSPQHRVLRRKKDTNTKTHPREERRKSDQNISNNKIKYISRYFSRSNTQELIPSPHECHNPQSQGKASTKNRRKDTSPPRKAQLREKNSQNLVPGKQKSEMKRIPTNDIQSKIQIEDLYKENSELKAVNQLLNGQLQVLSKQKQASLRMVSSLQRKIEDLNETLQKMEEQMKQKDTQIMKLSSSWPDNQSERQKSVLDKSLLPMDLQVFIQDFDKGVEDMLISKVPSEEEEDCQKTRYMQIIVGLRKKVSQLEVEVNMLKKFRFQVKEWRAKCSHLKAQMKVLANKLNIVTGHNLAKNRKNGNQKSQDYTFSLQLSEELEEVDRKRFIN